MLLEDWAAKTKGKSHPAQPERRVVLAGGFEADTVGRARLAVSTLTLIASPLQDRLYLMPLIGVDEDSLAAERRTEQTDHRTFATASPMPAQGPDAIRRRLQAREALHQSSSLRSNSIIA